LRQPGVWFATVLGLAACLWLPAVAAAQVVSDPPESISLAPLVDPATLFDEADELLVGRHEHQSLPTYEQPAEPWTISLMPVGLLYRSYAAAERDPRLSTTWLWDQQGNAVWDSALGGRVGLVRFGNSSVTNPEGFQLDVEGAAFVRLLPQEERDVGAVDFRAGLPLTYREGPWQAKVGYYHISSHLGDEFLLKRPGFNRLNYVRDSLVAGVGYFPVPEVRVYFEVGWAVIFTSGGAQPWEIQTGFEYDDHQPTGVRGAPYFALNIHLREEVDWGGSLNMLAGWQWRGDTTDHVFRIGLQFYNGKNAQYSFLQDNQQLLGFGVRYDY
jgi:hypothetical protein